MAAAPNLEGSIAALLLRVARLEDQLRQMDLPFVEDRLDNMETVVAALQRTIDTLSERFEVLLTLARGLEASLRSLERERRSMLILADRISHLESISRQETQGAVLVFTQVCLFCISSPHAHCLYVSSCWPKSAEVNPTCIMWFSEGVRRLFVTASSTGNFLSLNRCEFCPAGRNGCVQQRIAVPRRIRAQKIRGIGPCFWQGFAHCIIIELGGSWSAQGQQATSYVLLFSLTCLAC